MRHSAQRLLIIVVAALLWSPASQAQEALPKIAQVGPWPVVSKLVAFDGRLWFANSVKGRNHNSADLYSYDPTSGETRYERHLFSQDAGDPLVADGLLYWPFEDSRFSLGWGHFLMTDGTAWRYGTIPTAQIFHTHAMAQQGGDLIAATSAWRATLQRSSDGGRTWRVIYDHPTPERRVSRIVNLLPFGERLLADLKAREDGGLLSLAHGEVTRIPGWPHERPRRGLAAFRGQVYGLVQEEDGIALWRSDGVASERLRAPDEDWRARAIAAGDDALWVVTAEPSGGLVWRSPDGTSWEPAYQVTGGRPHELLFAAGQVFVSGAGDDGRGILWGPPAPVAFKTPSAGSLPSNPATEPNRRDWVAAAAGLEAMLAQTDPYARHGAALRDLIYELATEGPPEGFFAERLKAVMPEDELSLIGGAVRDPAHKLGRWLLLWGMTLAGAGDVPLSLLGEPWTATENGAEKYFDAPPAALWTVANIGQRDRATIAALIERLGRADDPLWLRGDVVGALTTVSGERFAYDIAAWRDWWDAAAEGWPD